MEYKTTIRTVLKNKNKDKIGTLFLEVVFIEAFTKKKIRRYESTGQRLHETDLIKSKIRTGEKTKLIRQIVDKKIVALHDKLRKLELTHGKVTPDIYDQSLHLNTHDGKTIFNLYDEFLKYQESNHEPLTVKKHQTVKNLLEAYASENNIKKLFLSDVDQNFYKNFTKFLKTTKKHAPQTVNKYQGCFKTFLKFLTDELHINQEEIHKKFKKYSKKTTGGAKVVLLKEHVQKLIDWKPTNERYELVRDLFLFQVLTGIRYSDLIHVNKSYVVNNSLSFEMWKVQKHVTIPLHSLALAILKKYNYELGEKSKSLQKYNVDIKTVCELAGLTENIKSLKILLSRKVPDETPLHKLVSTHVGRTTFITNCLISGISPFIVMEYTGHEKIDTLSTYMRIAGNMAKDAFAKYEEYFNFKT